MVPFAQVEIAYVKSNASSSRVTSYDLNNTYSSADSSEIVNGPSASSTFMIPFSLEVASTDIMSSKSLENVRVLFAILVNASPLTSVGETRVITKSVIVGTAKAKLKFSESLRTDIVSFNSYHPSESRSIR